MLVPVLLLALTRVSTHFTDELSDDLYNITVPDSMHHIAFCVWKATNEHLVEHLLLAGGDVV